MWRSRLLLIPLGMLFVLACGLTNGIRQMQQAVTQLPGELTSMPTMMGEVSTMAAGQPTAGGVTPMAGHLNISLDTVKTRLVPGRFSFTDTTGGGQPVSIAVLTDTAAASFPGLGKGFSARFIGEPANLSQILVTLPRTQDSGVAFEEIGLIDELIGGILPPDIQNTILPWVTQSYSVVAAGGAQQQTTAGNFRFTMQMSKSDITLEVDPLK